MRIVVVGSGGVGSAVAAIAPRRRFFTATLLTDLHTGRARPPPRTPAIHASPARASTRPTRRRSSGVARAERIDAILNACDPA